MLECVGGHFGKDKQGRLLDGLEKLAWINQKCVMSILYTVIQLEYTG